MRFKTPCGRRAAWPAVFVLAAPGTLQAQHAIEEIQVVGTPHDRSPSDIAQSVSVLAGETLRRSQSNTLGETLAGELGVSSTYFGSGSSRPVIRGLAGARVKVMEDGIDALDVSSVSVDHAVGVDPLAAQQIEIFRGPTTLLYGSGAVGGVVNTVTNRIPSGAPEDGFDAAVELRADSVARERSGAARLDGGGDRFAWHVDGSRRSTDDYEIPGRAQRFPDGEEGEEASGILSNSDFDTSSTALGAAWLGERASVGVSISTFDSRYGVPGHTHHDDGSEGHPEEEHAEDERVRIDLEQTRLDLRADWLGLKRFPEIELRLGINDYEHVELEGGEIGTRFRNDAYEGRIEVLHAPWGEWNGAFGAQLGERSFSAIGEEAFVPPMDTRTAGVFVLEDREIGAWQASLGARVDRVRHRPSNGAGTFSSSAASLSAAFIRRLADGLSLVVNAGSSERVPAAEELFSNGPHLASSTFEVGNSALRVETSRHLDVGLRRTEGRLTWALTGFQTRYDDFIYLAATGSEDEDSGLPVFAYLQRDAELVGLEAELFARVAEIGTGELDLRLYADYVRAELDDGDRLPRIPPRRQGLRIQYHDTRLIAGIEAVRYDDQRRTAVYETATDGYTLLGFDLGWKLRDDEDRPLDLFVKGTNLLDEEARKHASIVKDLAPLPGRNYSLGFRASF